MSMFRTTTLKNWPNFGAGITSLLYQPLQQFQDSVFKSSSVSQVTDVTEAVTPLITIGYKVNNPLAIAPFLHTYAFLIPTLQQMYHSLQSYFPQTLMEIKVKGIDIYGIAQELIVGIYSDAPFSASNKLLEQFDEEWWINTMPATKGLVTVVVEPV